jgi:hypothetical protein
MPALRHVDPANHGALDGGFAWINRRDRMHGEILLGLVLGLRRNGTQGGFFLQLSKSAEITSLQDARISPHSVLR